MHDKNSVSVVIKVAIRLQPPSEKVWLRGGEEGEKRMEQRQGDHGGEELGSELNGVSICEREDAVGQDEHAEESERPVVEPPQQPEGILLSGRGIYIYRIAWRGERGRRKIHTVTYVPTYPSTHTHTHTHAYTHTYTYARTHAHAHTHTHTRTRTRTHTRTHTRTDTHY